MSKFEYPKLDRRDIITYLEIFKIETISESDLTNPNSDFVTNLYTKLLICIEILQEDHGQVEYSALEHLENPDMHVDSVRLMNLCHKMMEFFDAVCCPHKFTLKDLVLPRGMRTENFLSAILNFCLHRETKLSLLTPVVDELTLREEEQTALEDRISQLNAEISTYNEARESEMPLVHEIDAKIKELRQTVLDHNNQQLSLRIALSKMKEKAGEMDAKIYNAEFTMVESVQENAKLRAKIVQSPEKLQRDLEEKKLLLLEATNAERSAMQYFQERTAIDEGYRKALKRTSKHSAQVHALQEQVNATKSIEKDVKVIQAKFSEDQVLDKSLEAKLIEQQGKVEQMEESRRQLERERDTKCEEATKELNKVKLNTELRRSELEMRQRKVETVVSEVDYTTSKIRTVKENIASKQQQLASKGEDIMKELYQYSNSIGDILPSIAELEIKVMAKGSNRSKKHKT